jgi:hypothetical protein
MKSWMLTKRVNDLSCKLDLPVTEKIARFDIRCFTEEEQLLFDRVTALQEKYGGNVPSEVLEANKDLIFKAEEVIAHYVTDTFKFVMLAVMGGGDEIEKWYFNLHFVNFLYDLAECLRHVQKWSKKERDDYLSFLKETGMINKAFRFPRGTELNENKR